MKWKKFEGATFYTIRWFEIDPVTLESITTMQDMKTTKLQYKFEVDVVSDRIYQWQVIAHNACRHDLAVSSCINFFTGNLTALDVVKSYTEDKRKRKCISRLFGCEVMNMGPPFIRGVGVYAVDNNAKSLAHRFGLIEMDIITKCNFDDLIQNVDDLYKLFSDPKQKIASVTVVRDLQLQA